MKIIIRKLLLCLRPIVLKFANLYGLAVEKHGQKHGDCKLEIAGSKLEQENNIPKSVYFNTASGDIIIGENVVFGEDVKLLTGKHMDVSEAAKFNKEHHNVPKSGREIIIKDGCYLGSNAIVIGPCVIGEYAVIGAGAVVTKDVPAKSFVAGNPAKVIKSLV